MCNNRAHRKDINFFNDCLSNGAVFVFTSLKVKQGLILY